MSNHILEGRPIWTPEDAAEAARDAAQHQTHRGAVSSDPNYAAKQGRTTTTRTVRRRLGLIAFGALLAASSALSVATPAKADAESQCITQFWWTLGSTQRTICDGPIRPDGSWMRGREFWTPAHYVRGSGYCSRYGGCSFTEGYYQERTSKGIETYPVTPDTVLPDEPGHIG